MLPAAAALPVIMELFAPSNNLAIIYKQHGNYAIACYNKVLRVDPLAADSLVNQGKHI